MRKTNSNKIIQSTSKSTTKTQQEKLKSLELTIKKGWDTFLEVGQALAKIRDEHLYKQYYDTFEEYCQNRWDFNRAHSYRLIKAAKVMELLSPIGDIPIPQNESQIRPLTKIKEDLIPKIWQELCMSNKNGKITAKMVKDYINTTILKNQSKFTDAYHSSIYEEKIFILLKNLRSYLKKHDLNQFQIILNELQLIVSRLETDTLNSVKFNNDPDLGK